MSFVTMPRFSIAQSASAFFGYQYQFSLSLHEGILKDIFLPTGSPKFHNIGFGFLYGFTSPRKLSLIEIGYQKPNYSYRYDDLIQNAWSLRFTNAFNILHRYSRWYLYLGYSLQTNPRYFRVTDGQAGTYGWNTSTDLSFYQALHYVEGKFFLGMELYQSVAGINYQTDVHHPLSDGASLNKVLTSIYSNPSVSHPFIYNNISASLSFYRALSYRVSLGLHYNLQYKKQENTHPLDEKSYSAGVKLKYKLLP